MYDDELSNPAEEFAFLDDLDGEATQEDTTGTGNAVADSEFAKANAELKRQLEEQTARVRRLESLVDPQHRPQNQLPEPQPEPDDEEGYTPEQRAGTWGELASKKTYRQHIRELKAELRKEFIPEARNTIMQELTEMVKQAQNVQGTLQSFQSQYSDLAHLKPHIIDAEMRNQIALDPSIQSDQMTQMQRAAESLRRDGLAKQVDKRTSLPPAEPASTQPSMQIPRNEDRLEPITNEGNYEMYRKKTMPAYKSPFVKQ